MAEPVLSEAQAAKFKKLPPLTLDDLRRYGASDLDPYTVQFGQVLCEEIVLSNAGQRNLITAFDALPLQEYRADNFETGYGTFHVVPALLKTNSGFLLVSVVGTLAECFHEDFVVDVFVHMARKFRMPDAIQPLKHQWRRMVDVLYGVLSTSAFGTLLGAIEDACPASNAPLDPERIVSALEQMSLLAQGKGKKIRIAAGADLPWVVTIASWLYDLKFVVLSSSSQFVYGSRGVQNESEADVVFTALSGTSLEKGLANVSLAAHGATSQSYALTDPRVIGGRVAFDRLFVSCFGKTFTETKEELLAAYICCASNMIAHALNDMKPGARFVFLSQATGTTGTAEFGLKETMMAWFPEIRRFSSRIGKYAKLNYEESRKKFNETYEQLQQQCDCSICRGTTAVLGKLGAVSTNRTCKVLLCEGIVTLGIHVSRMVVTSRLCPKRSGILTFYEKQQTNNNSENLAGLLLTPSGRFMRKVAYQIPLPEAILKAAATLFANANSAEIDAQKHLMGMTANGLAVFLTGGYKDMHAASNEARNGIIIRVSPGWMCLFGHEARFEIHKDLGFGWDVARRWVGPEDEAGEIMQILKWEDRTMLSSFVFGGKERKKDEKLLAEGWSCLRCRRSKLKCSGTQPCDRCKTRAKDCVYDGRDPRVTVTVSYLERLKRAASATTPANNQPPARALQEPSTDKDTTNSSNTVLEAARSSPSQLLEPAVIENVDSEDTESPADTPTRAQAATLTTPSFIANRPTEARRWLYLAASSPMAFNLRAISLLREYAGCEDPEDRYAFKLDGDAYSISWNKINSEERPNTSGLPPLDFALYLSNTVRFHLGSLLRLYDEVEFSRQLHEFYNNPAEKVEESRLWYTQYLLVLAVGQGLLSTSGQGQTLPGSEFFCRAMAIMPEFTSMYGNPMLAAEVLTLAALYFYCLDMKQSAYAFIGQAQRIALFEGMHTRMMDSVVGQSVVDQKIANRCSDIWFTIYILDRRLSAIIGAPTSVHDSDIKVVLPPPRSASSSVAFLSIHAKLSRMTSKILAGLYHADGSLETSYLTKVQATLRSMADLAEELEGTINNNLKNPVEALSKTAAYLRLVHHQCTILAIRPLLLCLLQTFFRLGAQVEEFYAKIPRTISDLLAACSDSAIRSIKLLEVLKQNYMLDSFLPFDLEHLSSAASVLIIVHRLLKFGSLDVAIQELSFHLLDDLIRRGSIPAQFRKDELKQLDGLSSQYWTQYSIRKAANQSSTDASPRDRRIPGAPHMTTGNANDERLNISTRTEDGHDGVIEPVLTERQEGSRIPLLNSSHNFQPPSFPLPENTGLHSTTGMANFDLPDYLGVSQQQIMHLADNLDVSAMPNTFDFGDVMDDWLWSVGSDMPK